MLSLIILIIVFSQLSALLAEGALVYFDLEYFISGISENNTFVFLLIVALINVTTILAVLMLFFRKRNMRLITIFSLVSAAIAIALLIPSLIKAISLNIALKEAASDPGYVNEGGDLIELLFFYSVGITQIPVFVLSLITALQARKK